MRTQQGTAGGIVGHCLADVYRSGGFSSLATVLTSDPRDKYRNIVILGTIQRLMGKTLSQQEVFPGVLRLEQALTTGGGWQDQIGGAVDGCKFVTTTPGLVPEARVHYVPAVEELIARVKPHVHGAKLLGAGGGGFLLMVCRSAQDTRTVRDLLTREPPNERARFFDFNISQTGLCVTVC